MKISQVMEELSHIKKIHGDIEVTCTGSVLRDGEGRTLGLPNKSDVFESTVENLIVNENHPLHGKAVRIWL